MNKESKKFTLAFKYLLEKGIVKSQEDFANQLQEDAGNISKYLNEKQDVPLSTIHKAIKIFELDANFFFHNVKKCKKFVEVDFLEKKVKEFSATIYMHERTKRSLKEQINNLNEIIDLLQNPDIVDVKAEEVKEQKLLP